MDYFVDTSFILRMASQSDPLWEEVQGALSKLAGEGARFYTSQQCLREAYTVLTRSGRQNGFALDPARALAFLSDIERLFVSLAAVESTHGVWLSLVEEYRITGLRAHDAFHVAVMKSYGLSHVLTYDREGFKHFPFLTLIDPASL